MRKKSGLMAAIAVVVIAAPTSADAPTVIINSPTSANVVYSAGFPFTQTIAFTVTHAGTLGQPRDMTDVKDLVVLIDGTAITGSAVATPWKVGSGVSCNLGGVPFASPYTACGTPDQNTGTGAIGWSVPAPGTYSITVRVHHASDTGEDVEAVQFSLLTAEYPAPPAVANAYIKSEYGKLPAKVHGCVISKIAQEHAKNEGFGPKGGPYNQTAIQNRVISAFAECSAP